MIKCVNKVAVIKKNIYVQIKTNNIILWVNLLNLWQSNRVPAE